MRPTQITPAGWPLGTSHQVALLSERERERERPTPILAASSRSEETSSFSKLVILQNGSRTPQDHRHWVLPSQPPRRACHPHDQCHRGGARADPSLGGTPLHHEADPRHAPRSDAYTRTLAKPLRTRPSPIGAWANSPRGPGTPTTTSQ
jgi:hypothetical protein